MIFVKHNLSHYLQRLAAENTNTQEFYWYYCWCLFLGRWKSKSQTNSLGLLPKRTCRWWQTITSVYKTLPTKRLKVCKKLYGCKAWHCSLFFFSTWQLLFGLQLSNQVRRKCVLEQLPSKFARCCVTKRLFVKNSPNFDMKNWKVLNLKSQNAWATLMFMSFYFPTKLNERTNSLQLFENSMKKVRKILPTFS